MMNQDHDKHEDLFRQMAEKLRGHADPYRQGAWERFAAKSGMAARPAKRKAWPYWAAAVLLVAVSAALLLRQPAGPAVEQYVGSGAPADPAEGTAVPATPGQDAGIAPELPPALAAEVLPAQTAERAGSVAAQPSDQPVAEPHDPAALLANEGLALPGTSPVERATVDAQPEEGTQPTVAQAEPATRAVAEQDQPSLPTDPVLPPLGESPPLYADAAAKGANHGMANEQESRWNLSVVVSPSLTSEKLNMGGGVALAYRISDKFSVSSGVSLAEMGVGQYPADGRHGRHYRDAASDYPAPSNGMVENDGLTAGYQALGNSYLTSVTSSLLAMDVPLDLRYHVSERFYSSVGVSMFAILDERRTVHYTTTTVSQNLNGVQYNRHDFSQQAAQQPIADQRVGGFLNFSVGHRVPLSKRVSLSLEPYFKVPMGNLSKQDMNLNHGGLKIVTGF